ncbi:sigma-70 family RNA polymerase sigma factor [Acaryochloris marina NIES-2412]|uniref:sigma-70 family RNA polymerase sigma factor n=1 Tax=Acaryochloris marina TaxID=155978 RepID=UPI004059926D
MVCVTSRNLQTQKPEQFSNEVQYPQILRAQAGDKIAEDRFIRRNIRLVFHEANRYRGLADWNDLVAAGSWGLARAIEKFDVSKGFKFSSYAEKLIKTDILQFLNDKRGLSKEIAKHLKEIKQASQDLEWKLERQPTLEELSERTGYSHRVINNAWDKARVVETYSLNIPFGENLKAEQLDLVEGDDDLWDYAENIDEKEYIAQLPERYNVIVRARRDGHSYRAIGRMLDLSGERIRQLFKEALTYLKHLVTYGACLVRFPQPLQAKEPEKVRKPVIKRVDASRLGGRIGRAIQQIFTQTQESFDYQHGELTHAQKHLLAFCRRSNHGTTNVTGHRLTQTDQRCSRLGQISDAWRGYLGFGQEKIQRPLVGAVQRIRGFSSKFNQWRNNIQFSTVTIFEGFGIGQGSNLPTNHKVGFSLETDSFSFGGINMSITKYLALACLFMFGLFAAPKLSVQSNHLIASVSHGNLDAQEFLTDLESLSTYIDKTESDIARDEPIQTQN